MNEEKFLQIYNEPRNGCNGFYRHPLARNFAYSDGVRDLADMGCWWLVDCLAVELPAVMRKNAHVSNRCIVTVSVAKGKCKITASFDDDVPEAWVRRSWTDMPSGVFKFLVADEGGETPYRCVLLSEY